ncbi:DUF3857 domain-containing protein [uncultured Kordia sp.]|uniref:DUF3857 domain-containing protein n=1 Tax=uncultured Kordia sp. TaxID=507699 RepID=UPI0026234316|nr:DUF3857 domain-containing protein [uncultured Kordia sp.]
MKLYCLLFAFLITYVCAGQDLLSKKFGTVSKKEINMRTYEKDTTAHAVVLEEYGDVYFDLVKDRIVLIKQYYTKIKVLDKQGQKYANIEIPYYHNRKSKEKIKDIKAVTHNAEGTERLADTQIFTIDHTENWSEKRFTFSNVKPGSVLEYQYTLETPFVYNFEGWDFQSDIPKIYSEFSAKIPGNYRYNRSLKGFLKLAINKSNVKKRCFYVPGLVDRADCEVFKYAMRDIPAFKEEAYMLSKNNYMSKIAFEMSEYYRFDGGKDVYTKTWKAVDKEMRTDKDIGAQVKRKNFFKNQLSDEILKEQSTLQRAKKVFEFIREHYTWNGEYGIFNNANVRQAFQNKTGNVAEVNLSLVNSLLAANIKAETVMLSTRSRGLPTQIHPVMSEFNYLVAKVTIGQEVFLLDATDKLLSFGLTQVRALNYIGRAMDFKKPSYWHTINPFAENRQNTLINISVDEEGNAKGKISQVNSGYLAYEKRKELANTDEDSYLDGIEKQIPFVEIDDYKIEARNDIRKPTKEFFFLAFNDNFSSKNTFLDPFFFKLFPSNPFRLEERKYPVDFAYSRIYTMRFIMSIPDSYEYVNIPENKTFKLAETKAICGMKTIVQNGQLNMTYKLVINDFHFTAEEYQELKTFFSNLATLESNTRLTIKKKN